MATKTEEVTEVGQPSFRMIPSNEIRRYEHQPRRHFDEQSIKELAVSIDENGQATAVIVTRRPNEDFYILIGGERRWRACGLLAKKQGSPWLVKANIEPYVDEDWLFKMAFLDNLHREDMMPLDIAAGFERLRQSSMSVENIAKLYGKSVPFVYNYLGLNGLDERVKALMHPDRPKDKRLGVTQAVEISKITDHNLQFQIADEAVVSRMTVRDLQVMAIQQSEEMGVPLRVAITKPARSRVGSDDYAILTTFLRNTESWLDRELRRLDFTGMYINRTDAEDDVMADTETLNRLLQKMRKLKLEVGKSL
jgi:ParB family transcriptional regulator, chromosome partitioning protein